MLEPILAAVGIYLGAGALFGLAFSFGGGAARIDPAARGTRWPFKLMIVPGCAVFWPLLLKRLILGTPPPEETSAHRGARL